MDLPRGFPTRGKRGKKAGLVVMVEIFLRNVEETPPIWPDTPLSRKQTRRQREPPSHMNALARHSLFFSKIPFRGTFTTNP